jgi:hypothetical protein
MLKFYPWVGAPIAAIILTSAYVLAPTSKLSASYALAGAIIAMIGVVTLARPIIRVGGYKKWYEKTKIIDYGHISPTSEEIAEDKEQSKDAAAIQLWGPALIVIGTLVNGASGFF